MYSYEWISGVLPWYRPEWGAEYLSISTAIDGHVVSGRAGLDCHPPCAVGA